MKFFFINTHLSNFKNIYFFLLITFTRITFLINLISFFIFCWLNNFFINIKFFYKNKHGQFYIIPMNYPLIYFLVDYIHFFPPFSFINCSFLHVLLLCPLTPQRPHTFFVLYSLKPLYLDFFGLPARRFEHGGRTSCATRSSGNSHEC